MLNTAIYSYLSIGTLCQIHVYCVAVNTVPMELTALLAVLSQWTYRCMGHPMKFRLLWSSYIDMQ